MARGVGAKNKGRAVRGNKPLTILESVRAIKSTTNPYIVQLIESLRKVPNVKVRMFSYRTAILGRYDVYHVHWPEVNFGGHKRLGRVSRRLLATLFLARLMLTRTSVVRTWHNLERPQGLSRYDHFLLDSFERMTTLRIGLNEDTPFPKDGKLSTVIRHGHYRDWYAGQQHWECTLGRIGFAGAIRRYKGVEDLVSAFMELDAPGLTLHIAGRPSTVDLETQLTNIAKGDDRVSFEFKFLDDSEFVREITRAELVVLPYRHMHNSGIVLACLSLGRPVLVPDNDVNRKLAAEVGCRWLYFFEGTLTAEALREAIEGLRSVPPEEPPDLHQREWGAAGVDHVVAFRRAIEARHLRRGPLEGK